jgi:hypothetical protein
MSRQYFIFSRCTGGCFDLRKLDGMKVSASAGYKKLRLQRVTAPLCERRQAFSSTNKMVGFRAWTFQ